MSGPSWAGAVMPGSLRPQPARRRSRALLVALVAALVAPASAAAQAIQEFPVPAGSFPGGITTGPDGNLWFTAEGTGDVGRMTPQGAVTIFEVSDPNPTQPPTDPAFVAPVDQITPGADGALWFTLPLYDQVGRITTDGSAVQRFNIGGPGGGERPEAITPGPDGNLWFTAPGINHIGRIVPSGSPGIQTFPGASPGASDIAAADGALWFTESFASSIGRMTTGGAVTNHFGVTAGSEPSGITAGPGGGVWFTESAANQIGHISSSGTVTEFPGAGAGPSAIEAGRDGALWFTESEGNAIGRITTNGAVTNHFGLPNPGSEPSDITPGPDGALWFTEFQGQRIGRIDSAVPGTTTTLPTIKPLLPKKKAKKRCKVPKVRGLAVSKAKKKLRKAKCKFRFKGRGYVVRTKPGAGKRTTKRVQVTAKPKVAKSSSREGNRP
jgi:streptogramin lyase